MKALFYSLIFLFCLITNTGNAALMKCSIAAGQNQNNEEIIFVDSSQIHFSDYEVFAMLNNEMVPLYSLCGDYCDVFIEYNLAADVGYWVCPRCAQKNSLCSLPYCETPGCHYVCPRVR